MAQGRTLVEILHPEDHINLDNTQDRALTLRQLQTALNGLANGALGHQDTTVFVAQGGVQASGSYALSGVGGTAATGSVSLSGVGGTASSNAVTLGGDAGDLTITVDGTAIGPVAFNTSDEVSAQDWVTEANLDGAFAAKATASSVGDVITITWDTKGTVGDSKTISASRTAGTATVGGNGTTLGGGAQGGVTVTVDVTAVGPVDTTNLSDTAAATAVAAALEANGTLGPLLTAVGDAADVEITWGTKGTVGNAVALESLSVTGTATASDATLTGGEQGAVTVGINGTSVGPVDTTNLTDTAAATAVAAAVEANGTLGPLLAAVGSTTNVNITWGAKGTAGNAVTLAAGTSATGTATRSGATLTGGEQGSVTATVNGTAEVTDTTNLTDAGAATLIASELNANATINDYVTAEGVGDDVVITAIPYGAAGNLFTLGAGASDTGTATRSGATLTGGTEPTGNFLERP